MKKPTAVVLTFGLFTVVAANPICAQNEPGEAIKGSARVSDEAAIRETSQALARAFEKGDAKLVAGFWTPEGEYVDEGSEPIHGRDALEKAYAGFFAERPDLKSSPRPIRSAFWPRTVPSRMGSTQSRPRTPLPTPAGSAGCTSERAAAGRSETPARRVEPNR